KAQSGRAKPVLPDRPALALQPDQRQQQQKADAEAERPDRERIDQSDQIARRADRGSAKAARKHGCQYTPSCVHSARSTSCLKRRVRRGYQSINGIYLMSEITICDEQP